MAKVRSKLAIFMALIFILSFSAAGCALVEKSPEAVAKEKVAKVGKEYIIRSELDEIVNYNKQIVESQEGVDSNYFTTDSGKQQLLQMRKDILNSLTEQKVVEQKAAELKLFKDENEINDQVQKTINEQVKNGKSDEEYKKWLDDAKLTPELLNRLVRMQVISDKVYENTTKDVNVTDEEIKNYYNTNQLSYTEKPDTMEVSHILVKTEDEAKQIKDKLDKGGDFAQLSTQYSIDDGAKKSGGSLGEIAYNDPHYDQTFMMAAMALKEGEISQPVHTQFGYHIIKVTKKTEYPVLPLDKVKEDIKTTLLRQKKDTAYNKALSDWKAKAGIKILDKELAQ